MEFIEPPPPAPATAFVEVCETDDVLALSYSPRSLIETMGHRRRTLIVLFCCTVFVVVAGLGIASQDPWTTIRAASFFVPWFCFALGFVCFRFQAQRLEMTGDGIRVENKIDGLPAIQGIPPSEIQGITEVALPGDSKTGATDFAVRITFAGREFDFGMGCSEEECRWLAWKIRARMQFDTSKKNGSPARPKASAWTLEDDSDSLVWLSKGRLRWGIFIVSFIASVLLNGIVGFCVAKWMGFGPLGWQNNAPQGASGWLSALMLFPFMLAGLAMLRQLFGTIAEVFRRTTWTIRPGEMKRVNRWLGIGFSRRYPFGDDCYLMPSESSRKPWGNFKPAPTNKAEDNRFELAVLDREGTKVCAIGGLTLGEARWMRAEIAARRPGWFRWDEPPE